MSTELETVSVPAEGERVSAKLLRKNLSVVGLTYAVAGVAGFAAQAVLARHVSRDAFGNYIAALSLVAVTKVLDRLARDEYIVREGGRDPGRLQHLVGTILSLKLVTGVLVVGISGIVALIFGFTGTTVVVAMLLAAMAGADAVSDSFRSGLQALERLEVASAISMAVAGLSAAGMVVVISSGGGLVGAVAASTAVSFAAVPVSWLALNRRLPIGLVRSGSTMVRVMKESFPYTAAGVLSVASHYVDALVVRGSLGPRPTALYGAGYRIIAVLGWIPTVYQTSVYRSISFLAHQARTEFGPFVQRSAAGLCVAGLPFAVGGMILGDRVLTLVFGQGFGPGAHAFRILLWSLPVAFPAVVLLTAVIVDERPQAAALIFAAAFVGNLATNLALVPTFGIDAAAWITVATDGFTALVSTIILARRGIPPRWPVLAAPGAVAAASMAAAIYPLRDLVLAVPLAVGAVVYTGVLLAADVPRHLGLSFSLWRRTA